MNEKRLLHISIFLTCFLSLLLCFSISYAEDIAYTESGNSITLDIKIPDIGISEIKDDDGNTYHKISIPDSNFVTNKEGSPQLPYISRNIHIPDQATNVSVTTQVNGSPAIYNDILVYPAPKTVIKTNEEGYVYLAEEFYIEPEIYESEEVIPNNIAIITQDGYFRSVRMIKLDIYPVRYTPKIKTLQLIKDLSLTITYTIDPSIPTKKDTTEGFDKLIDKLIINPESVEKIEEPLKLQVLSEPLTTEGSVTYITGSQLRDTAINCDYLIVTHSNFFSSTELAEFANYRANYNKLNIVIAKVDDIYIEFPNTSGNDYSIKDFVQYAYDNWAASPQYLLIVGDVEYVPSHQISNGSMIMDYEDWYVCISGGDEWPDLAMGRFSVKTESGIGAIKDKIISYEQNPIIPGDYHKRAIYIEGTSVHQPHMISILSHAGFEVTELYKLYGNTKQEFINAMNCGQNFVYWVGHGADSQWEYQFRKEDIPLLNNNAYPIILTHSCFTADLNNPNGESIGEEFVRTEGKGAVAYYGATVAAGTTASYEILETLFYDFEYSLGKTILFGEILRDNLWASQFYILLGDPAMQVFGYGLIPGLPDLTLSPSGVDYDSSTQQLTLDISNIGEVDASNVPVEVFIIDDLTGEMSPFANCILPTVASDDSATMTISVVPPRQGEFSVIAVVDPDNSIAESIELNNQNGKRIPISPTFVDVTAGTGLGSVQMQWWSSISKADINGDGYFDICLSDIGYNFHLFLNNGNGAFSDITASSGTGCNHVRDAAFGDINNDGHPDLFICRYPYDKNKLFLNNRDNTFADISASSGVSVFTTKEKPIFGDIDNDGDLDIYLADDEGNILLLNNGDNTFVDETVIRGVGGLKSIIKPVFVDIDDDNDLDLLVICYQDSIGYLRFYLNDGTGIFAEETPSSLGVPKCYADIGMSDIDLDGDFDLLYFHGLTTNGKWVKLMRNNGANNFQCIYKTNFTTALDLDDASAPPPLIFAEIDNIPGEDIMWGRYYIKNSSNGIFKHYESTKHPYSMVCRYYGLLSIDFDEDGDNDIVEFGQSQLNPNEPWLYFTKVLQNQTDNNNWLKVKPVGVQSNHDAIGAKVYVYASSGELIGHQEVSTQNPAPLHFGVDSNDTYKVVVHWPKSGVTDIRQNVNSTQLIRVVEGEPDNRLPILNPIGNRTGNEATNFVISKIVATDPDNDPITIEASNLPNGARFFQVSPSNIGRVEYKLSWPAKFVRQGVYENITFTARDSSGATDSETISITIRDTQNFSPVLVPIRNRTGRVGQDFVIKGIVATDFDNDPITIEVQNAPPTSWITQVSTSNIGKVEYKFVWRARGITRGVHTLTFIAHDPAGGIDSETITITIP